MKLDHILFGNFTEETIVDVPIWKMARVENNLFFNIHFTYRAKCKV